ncbi:hypothetical protein LTR85_008642 [Meristemomyces frigidus]|nr:hypothetical protein LTR85_008642 [Meristemomyces frigidus]
MVATALRPPIELFLPNTNERCVLTFLVDHRVLAADEHIALAKGYIQTACDTEAESGDIFSGPLQERIVAKIYMPGYSAGRSHRADDEMAALSHERESGCEDVPLVIASIIKDPTGVAIPAATSDYTVKLLHFVVLDRAPAAWLEVGSPDPAIEAPVQAHRSRTSQHDSLSPSRRLRLDSGPSETDPTAVDETSMMAGLAVATPEDPRDGIDGRRDPFTSPKFGLDCSPHDVRHQWLERSGGGCQPPMSSMASCMDAV